MWLSVVVGVFLVLSFLAGAATEEATRSKHLVRLGDDNWKQTLHGEWIVQFRSPSCAPCAALWKTWNALADSAAQRRRPIAVAEVDVTRQAALGGRFMITHLPTIYHAKDGVFRRYDGAHTLEQLQEFLDGKWTLTEPRSRWISPDSPIMSAIAYIFSWLVVGVDLGRYLVEERGIPQWVVYMLLACVLLTLLYIPGYFIVHMLTVTLVKELKKLHEAGKKDSTAAYNADEASNDKGGAKPSYARHSIHHRKDVVGSDVGTLGEGKFGRKVWGLLAKRNNIGRIPVGSGVTSAVAADGKKTK